MDELIKAVGVIATLFAVYKIVVDVVLARSARRRDEYKFVKEYLLALKNDSEHTYTLEKGFFALTGSTYPVPEIKFLLAQPSPSTTLELRRDSDNFVSFNNVSKTYEWKGVYRYNFARVVASKWFFAWYVVTASLALTPIFINGFASYSDTPVTIFSASLFVIAVSCLIRHSNFKKSVSFMSGFKIREPHCSTQLDTNAKGAA
ncbi:hypothetical protein [Microbulbifer pacificus]|uniref:hypothetical protein n=1 Tax=Microbulbifer pacificus TaxID=407164 RepID=UPI001319EA90|nr:hypothetical protein [Microbulbifer pacificus]